MQELWDTILVQERGWLSTSISSTHLPRTIYKMPWTQSPYAECVTGILANGLRKRVQHADASEESTALRDKSRFSSVCTAGMEYIRLNTKHTELAMGEVSRCYQPI